MASIFLITVQLTTTILIFQKSYNRSTVYVKLSFPLYQEFDVFSLSSYGIGDELKACTIYRFCFYPKLNMLETQVTFLESQSVQVTKEALE